MKNATTREIKFRAWVDGFLPEQSGMFTVFSLERIQADGSVDRITATRSGRVAVVIKFKSEEEPFTLMQFTGLQDKHGTEIYEGDILKAGFGGVTVVKWSDKAARFFTSGLGLPVVDWSTCEVIGNIHENPELLT